jgi:methyl-accepting chemotaxis protein
VSPPGILDRLVGDGARVAIGNLAGDVWTDFTRVIHAPPVDLAHRGIRRIRFGGQRRYLGAVTPIPNTSWAAWVEFPESNILAPAQRVLNRMVSLALIFFVVGVGLVTMGSIGLTRPLRQLSAVAARIGNGDYSGRIITTRSDEIGRFGRGVQPHGQRGSRMRMARCIRATTASSSRSRQLTWASGKWTSRPTT